MNDWMLRNAGKINAVGIALNFWLAATNFEKGGWWLIYSALHVATCLLVAHFWIKLEQSKKACARADAEWRRLMETWEK